jgi:nucleoside phosphorylase/V8-like Glu-specific endopeptidase/DNA-binding NarL/FixJ family response regulator
VSIEKTEPNQQPERQIVPDRSYLSSDFHRKLVACFDKVCRVEVRLDSLDLALGTGFLIGPDLVITNYHVMEYLIDREKRMSSHERWAAVEGVTLRFDYEQADGENVPEKGKLFTLHPNKWLYDYSPMGPSELKQEEELDYAILKLDGRPGDERGWLHFPSQEWKFEPDSFLIILQYPDGKPLCEDGDQEAVVGLFRNGTRVRYRINTEKGSSGGPCFNINMELVALHRSGDVEKEFQYNEGVPINAIKNLLLKRGKWEEIDHPETKKLKAQVILEGNFTKFTLERQQNLILVLSALLAIDPTDVRVLKVEKGSIVITLEMPEIAANRIYEMAVQHDFRITQLGIRSISIEGRESIELTEENFPISNKLTKRLSQGQKNGEGTLQMVGSETSLLIVDDDQDLRDKLETAIRRDFEGEVVRIFPKATYLEAVEFLKGRKNVPSVALIDICLDKNDPRNEDGFLLADTLRAKGSRTEIIFSTDKFSLAQYKKAETYKPAHFHEKPPVDQGSSVSVRELTSAVKKAYEQAEAIDVFVMMPFKEEYKAFYKNKIQPFFTEKYPLCRRADEFFHPGIIMREIVDYIKMAKFSLADLSGRNKNVLIEVGIAHALEKNVVMIARSNSDFPKLLGPVRHIQFSEERADDLLEKLDQSVQELQRKNYQFAQRRANAGSVPPSTCVILAPKYADKNNVIDQMVHPVLQVEQIEPIDLLKEAHGIHLIEGMWEQIRQASLVIVDLTHRDLDVFYLAGFAYGLEKNIIFISNNEDNIPFDLKDCSYILYPDNYANADLKRDIELLRKINKIPLPPPAEVKEPAGEIHPVLKKLPKADVLLVTAVNVECNAVLSGFKPITRQKAQLHYSPHSKNTYYELGCINGSNIVMIQTEKGNLNAALMVTAGIKELKPGAVIMVGIAFGMNPAKQRLGDVLVSDHILYYELQRYSVSPDGKPLIQLRGPRADSPQGLLGLFNAIIHQKRIRAHIGLILSGDKLVDNPEFKASLCSYEPRAVGGEMEGAGLYYAAKENNVDWILVKGISDWADGNKKGEDEDKLQKTAAQNAVKLVLEALKIYRFDDA